LASCSYRCWRERGNKGVRNRIFCFWKIFLFYCSFFSPVHHVFSTTTEKTVPDTFNSTPLILISRKSTASLYGVPLREKTKKEAKEKKVSRQGAKTQRNIKKRRRKRRKVFQSGFIRSFEAQLF